MIRGNHDSITASDDRHASGDRHVPDIKDDADRLLKNMTLRQKIGQLFVVAAHGGFYTHDDSTGFIFYAGHGIAATGNPHFAYQKGYITGKEAIDEVQLAVLAGEITEQKINESVRRILTEKIRAGLFDREHIVDLSLLPERINTREHRLISDHIAIKLITLLRNKIDLLLRETERYDHAVVVNITDGRRRADDHLSRILDEHFTQLSHVEIYPGQCECDSLLAVKRIEGADLIFAVSLVAIRTAEEIKLDDTNSPFMSTLFPAEMPIIAITLETPYAIKSMKDVDVHDLGRSPDRRQQVAVGNAMLGTAPINGRLQVSIPPLYLIGDGLTIDLKKPE